MFLLVENKSRRVLAHQMQEQTCFGSSKARADVFWLVEIKSRRVLARRKQEQTCFGSSKAKADVFWLVESKSTRNFKRKHETKVFSINKSAIAATNENLCLLKRILVAVSWWKSRISA